MRNLLLFVVGLAVLETGVARASAPEPLWFYDGTHRYFKLSLESFGKVHITVRSVSTPGEASYWLADGEKADKEITFARSVGENEARGTFYVATGGEGSVKVKIQSGQDKEKAQDEGVVGLYHHISEEKRLFLAKKEFEGAEKHLAEAHKAAAKAWLTPEKPVLAEIKTRWPDLRERILALREKPKTAQEAAPRPRLASLSNTSEVSPDKKPDRWFSAGELTAMNQAFMTSAPDPKVTTGWEGDYQDGFGGTVSIYLEKDGRSIRFALNCTRGGAAEEYQQTGMMNGVAKLAADDDMLAQFTDTAGEGKSASEQAQVKLHRVGRYLIVDASKTGKYTVRGWFDGVYRKQPPAVAQ